MNEQQRKLLAEIQEYKRVVSLHALDQPLTDDLVAIIRNLIQQIKHPKIVSIIQVD